MKKGNSTGFFIHDFMIDKLCLTGVPLTVFALIYSFTVAGADCHGSIDYIANRVGASTSSVKRALSLLVDRKLIIKNADPTMRTKIYRTNPIVLIGKDPSESQIDPPGTDMVPESNSAFKESKTGYNNKEIINTSTTTSSTRQSDEDISYFVNPGEQGVAVMTMRQHLDLRERLGGEMLEYYIMRLEDYIIANPDRWIKNHYKTILKWARDDAALE